MRRVQRAFDVGGVRARHFAEFLAIDRARVGEIAALDRRLPLAADEIVVARPQPAALQGFCLCLVEHRVLLGFPECRLLRAVCARALAVPFSSISARLVLMQIKTADYVGVITIAGEAANADAARIGSGRVIRPCMRHGSGMPRRRP
jgi:hypothetical protein